MTSEFDSLAIIYHYTRENPKFEKISFWLADICIEEVNQHRENWQFEKWIESEEGNRYKFIYGEKWIKFAFLNRTHDVLDHFGGLHGKVFTKTTWYLIDLVKKAIVGDEIIIMPSDIMKRIRKKFPEIDSLLKEIGYKWEEFYWRKEK